MNFTTPRYIGMVAAVAFVAAVASCAPAHAGSVSEDLKYTQALNKAIAADLKLKKAADKEVKAGVRLEKQKEKLAKACAALPDHESCKGLK